jgi:ADP-ribose pyrophosphatase
VNIIALTENNKELITIRQYRHSVQKISLETPGGVIDASDPSPLDAAKRELKEETGYISDKWYPLGTFNANPAVMNNTCHAYLALHSRKISEPDLDITEDLETKIIPLNTLVEKIEKEEIINGITLSVLLKFEFFKIKNPKLFSDLL